MAESGSTDQPKPQFFCCTCKQVIGVSKKEHEYHDIREKEQAKKDYKDELTKKLNEKAFVERLQIVESQIRCLELLGHHPIKIELSHVDGLRCYQASKDVSQILLNSLPFIYNDCQFKNKDAGNIRIASWNLTDFSSKFMTLPNKIEIVCETIVHHQFDIVALQEVGETTEVIKNKSVAAIHKLHTELRLRNKDAGWKLKITDEPIGKIKQGTPVYGVFLYKSSHTSGMVETEFMVYPNCEPETIDFGREPITVEFRIGGVLKFSLVNFHLTPKYGEEKTKRNEKQLEMIPILLDICSTREDLLLGDFNNYVKESTAVELYEKGYRNLFGEGETTTTSTKYPSCLDAIIVHPEDFKLRCTQYGVAGIVLKGDITPEDISTHKPIWADFV